MIEFLKKQNLPPLVWYIIFETALSRIAFFMCMPFIALKLTELPDIKATSIGLIIGVGPLISTIISFYVGHISDIFGRKTIITLALSFWAIVFILFAKANSPFTFAICMGINGLVKGIFEPVSTALLSDLCKENDPSGATHKKAYHLRYFAINIGAAIGPLIGATFIIDSPQISFYTAAIIYLLSAIFFHFYSIGKIKFTSQAKSLNKPKLTKTLKIMSKDKRLQLYLWAFFFISVGLSQFDSTLPIYLKKLFNEQGKVLFASMLSLNGFLVVLLTLPILSFSKKYDIHLGCAVSSVFWAIGIFSFGLSQTSGEFLFAISVLTLGEIVVFANGYLLIEALAPENLKASYLSTVNLSHLGVVVGPYLGGLIYDNFGGKVTFITMSIFLVITSLIYLYFYSFDKKESLQVKA